MEATTEASRKSEPIIPLASLPILSFNVQLPEEQITKTERRDSAGNIIAENQSTSKTDFSCSMKVSWSAPLSVWDEMGLLHHPATDLKVSLFRDSNGGLLSSISYSYATKETRTRTEYYNHRWVPEGQRCPYGPVEDGYMDSDQREESYEVDVIKNFQTDNAPLGQNRFNILYLSALNSASVAGRDELINYLHAEYPCECQAAQTSIRTRMAEIAERARQEALRTADVFGSLKLPELS